MDSLFFVQPLILQPMKTLNSLKDLKVLKNNSVEYKGKLADYQQKGNTMTKKTVYEEPKFTDYQNLLYKRALYGLNMYTQKEIKDMHWEKRKRISRVNRRAQRSLNLFKQECTNLLCDKFYHTLFPNSILAKNVFSLEKSATDPKIINTLDLDNLGIKKEHVIKRFVKEGILPKDFYELKQAV